MNEGLSPDGDALVRRASKNLLLPVGEDAVSRLDREAVKASLPHRDPFLFIDNVMNLDLEAGLIAATYDLERSRDVFGGHFPGEPVWPGVLQIEAIAQAGGLLVSLQSGGARRPTLTHVVAARFIQPIRPGGRLWINSQVFEEELFILVVGQCVRGDTICSAAALRGL